MHRLYPTIYKSPLCDCGKGVQDNYHVLLECEAKTKDFNNFIFELKACFAKNNEVRDAGYHANILFLNASRDALTLKLTVERITVLSETLRKAISLLIYLQKVLYILLLCVLSVLIDFGIQKIFMSSNSFLQLGQNLIQVSRSQ